MPPGAEQRRVSKVRRRSTLQKDGTEILVTTSSEDSNSEEDENDKRVDGKFYSKKQFSDA